MVMRFFLIVASPARSENGMCSHPRTSDATAEKIAEKNREKFNVTKSRTSSKFVAKCSHHRALATRQFSKKPHHHRKQKIARVAAA